jgi:hypothetical protein
VEEKSWLFHENVIGFLETLMKSKVKLIFNGRRVHCLGRFLALLL